jgi:hypothetical protein
VVPAQGETCRWYAVHDLDICVKPLLLCVEYVVVEVDNQPVTMVVDPVITL